jgi:glycosyltransferase involved in cell wall biosynthesis
MTLYSKPPKVSIILPVFNGAKTLLTAVRSVVDQEYGDWELLVLDDGSSDNCTSILEQLKDPRITVFADGFRKGLATRLNEGVDRSKGMYIARMDADDLCFPDRLKKQVEFLEKNKDVDLVASKVVTFNQINGIYHLNTYPFLETHDQLTAKPWLGIYMPHPSWMGRSSWFRKFPYLIPEVVRAEDQELLLRALPYSNYHCLPQCLLAYRKASFNFEKSFLARRSLYLAQVRIFFSRGQILSLLKVTIITILKITLDLYLFLYKYVLDNKVSPKNKLAELEYLKVQDLLSKYG